MSQNANGIRVCLACNFVGQPEKRGSGFIEFILWCAYLVPGIIYSIWRRNNTNSCPQCRSVMIPASTPKAQEILNSSPALRASAEIEQSDFAAREWKRSENQKFIDRLIYWGLAVLFLVFTVLIAIGN